MLGFYLLWGVKFIIHYLDDYFSANVSREGCRQGRDNVVRLCDHLGVPLAPENIIGPSQVLVFLGLEIDSVKMEIRLPEDKLVKIKRKVGEMMGKRKVLLQELLSLIGLLNFATKVVKPGRMFVRRLIDLSMSGTSLFHFVYLNQEAMADLDWWHVFLDNWNGVSLIPAPLRSSPDIDLFTDASDLGFGCVFGGRWTYGGWPEGWVEHDINIREAFAIWVAVRLWGGEWRDAQIVIHTDSAVNTAVWKSGTCRDRWLMRVVRRMFMFSARINLNVTLLHVPGCFNRRADLLSRFKVTEFLQENPGVEPIATPVPVDVWKI